MVRKIISLFKGISLRPLVRQTPEAKKKTNAEYCKEYRTRIKSKPDLYEELQRKNKSKCKYHRQKQLTEEELELRRQKGRERSKRFREKKRAERGPCATSTPKPQPKTRKAVEKQREAWRQQKRSQRQNWSAQKWRRHREYVAKNKKFRKEPQQEPDHADVGEADVAFLHTPSPRPSACHPEIEAEEMLQPADMLPRPDCSTKAKSKYVSPSPKTLKAAFKSKVEELKRRRSKGALAKRQILFELVSNAKESEDIRLYERSKRTPATKNLIQYFETEAVNLPGKDSVSRKTKQQKKVLPKRMKRLHHEYNRQNPQMKISLRSAYRHLPKHILTSRRQGFRQCLCEICINIDLKLDVVNKYLSEPIDGRDILCEKSLCGHPTIVCHERRCSICGVDGVRRELEASLSHVCTETTHVEWKIWDMVQTARGKRRELVSKTGSLNMLLHELCKEVQPFAKHMINFRWQFTQFKTLQSSLPEKWVLAVFDFAENFQCKYQNEVQSAHWSLTQVAVHPTVLYYHCPQCSELVTDYVVYLSNDLLHDAHFVDVVSKRTKEYLRRVLGEVRKLVIFSDGCSSQYKSKLPFHLLGKVCDIPVERCFFGSRHGKSACDACGGVVKRLVEDDILAGAIIQNAQDMHRHCEKNFIMPRDRGNAQKCHHTRRSFDLIEGDDIERGIKSSDLETIPGTRQLHSIKPLAENIFATRKLSCFCPGCISGNKENCANLQYVSPWEVVKLRSKSSKPETMEDTVPQEHDYQQDEPAVPYHQALNGDPPTSLKTVLEKMCKCSTYRELEQLVEQTDFTVFILPDVVKKTVVEVGGIIDAISLQLRPPSTPSHMFPVETVGDGNCLPRSVSKIVFGTEEFHEEIRCLIVAELVKHQQLYVKGEGMSASEGDEVCVAAMVAILSEESGLIAETTTLDDIIKVFEREVLQICALGQYMGLWQLAAVANILGAQVNSVFPARGWQPVQDLNNRTLQPRQVQREPIYIMWTSSRLDMLKEHWTPNHFVPLLPMTDPSASVTVEEKVQCNDFFQVNWEGRLYVAQVVQIDGDIVQLQFMQEKNGYFTWPINDDVSWEDRSALSKKVHLELDATKSSQRVQYFKLV